MTTAIHILLITALLVAGCDDTPALNDGNVMRLAQSIVRSQQKSADAGGVFTIDSARVIEEAGDKIKVGSVQITESRTVNGQKSSAVYAIYLSPRPKGRWLVVTATKTDANDGSTDSVKDTIQGYVDNPAATVFQ